MSDERERLRAMIQREAVRHGDFVLSSGRRANFYIDCRLVTLSAEGSYLVGKCMLSLLDGENVDAVAGMTLGADPIVTAIALVSYLDARPIPGLIVRKEAKEHGLSRQVEGPLREGMRVAVVEDTSTTGGSVLRAVTAVEDAGGVVERVLSIIDRGEGARDNIEARGYRFDYLFSLADLGLA